MHLGAMPRGNAAAVGPRLGLAAAPQNPRSKPSPGEGERGVPGAAGRDGPEGGTREGSGDVKMQHHPPAPANSPRVCVRREGRREGKEGGGQRRFPAGGGGPLASSPPGEAGLGSERALRSRQRSHCDARATAARGGPPAGGGSCSLATGREEGKKSEGKKRRKARTPLLPALPGPFHTHTARSHTHTPLINIWLSCCNLLQSFKGVVEREREREKETDRKG